MDVFRFEGPSIRLTNIHQYLFLVFNVLKFGGWFPFFHYLLLTEIIEQYFVIINLFYNKY